MPETRNANELSIDQLQTILNNDRIRQHLIQSGYIDRQGNITSKGEDDQQSRQTMTGNSRQPQSPDYNSNNHRLKSASTSRSKWTNQSFDSARVRNVLLRRAVSPQILPAKHRCRITMTYYGPGLNIEYDREWFEPHGDEVLIMQQHCGGENYLAFKGFLKPDEKLTFDSRRHADYPFALAFYLNGVFKDRLSVCCEFRCNNSMRIGGKRCLVAITKVENARPCRRCRFEQRMKKLKEESPEREVSAISSSRPTLTQGRERKGRSSSKSKRSRSRTSSTHLTKDPLHTKGSKSKVASSDTSSPEPPEHHKNGSSSSKKPDFDQTNSKSKTNSVSKSKVSSSDNSNSEPPESHKKSSNIDKHGFSSSKKLDSDESDLKENLSSTKHSKSKANRVSKAKVSNSDFSTSPEPPGKHKKSPNVNKDGLSNQKPVPAPVKSAETKKIRPPSPKEVDSEILDTDPPGHHVRFPESNQKSAPSRVKSAEIRKTRPPSPKEVDSDTDPPVPPAKSPQPIQDSSSSPDLIVSSKKSPPKKNDGLPSPQPVDSASSDSKPPVLPTRFPKPDESRKSSSPIQSNGTSPSNASKNTPQTQPSALPVEIETITDDSDLDFGEHLSALKRRNEADN